MSHKVYTVIKDGLLENTTCDREKAISLAQKISGLSIKVALSDVQVYESTLDGSNPKMIWSINWESQGPLEPTIYAATPSLIPAA